LAWTQEGLVRFDGIRFTVFDSQNSTLNENNIQALFEDREGNLWVGTDGGGVYWLIEVEWLRASDVIPDDCTSKARNRTNLYGLVHDEICLYNRGLGDKVKDPC
jgi:ligand-binding sensor domain-containing protein